MSHPSAPDLAERIAALSPAKRELLERRLRDREAEALRTGSIPRRARAGQAPLSFAQQRLWFLDQLEPGSVSYNVPRALRIRGPLAIEALRRALAEIVDRHEVLRTTFSSVDGQPVQVVGDRGTLLLPLTDLTHLAPSAREAEVARVGREEEQTPFDLAHGPLFRVRLLRLGRDEHVLMLTNHHIVSDAWSAGVLFRELGSLYGAFSQDKPSPLEPLAIQYADFAEWQRGPEQSEVLQNAALILEGSAFRSARVARSAGGPAPARRSQSPRRALGEGTLGDPHTGVARVQSERGGHALHDPSLGTFRSALSLHRPRGHRRRFSHRGPDAAGARGLDRLLSEHSRAEG